MSISSPAPGGLFIALEGGDGAGKSTQAALLAAALEQSGRSVLRTREPGGTPVGEQLRSLVLEHGNGDIDARTEALMFAASRAAHVAQVIRPALSAGVPDPISHPYEAIISTGVGPIEYRLATTGDAVAGPIVVETVPW